MHAAAFGYVARLVLGPPPLPPRRAVVDIGARDINGSVRQLFAGARYLGIDLEEGHGVDVVADGATYDPPFVPDTVVCCEVLEHTPAGPAILANAYRVLGPYGLLIVTCAGMGRPAHSGADGGPLKEGEHYANIGKLELREWLRPFAVCHVEHGRTGDLWAYAWKDGA
jgi:SAM-dependent methyltransferase